MTLRETIAALIAQEQAARSPEVIDPWQIAPLSWAKEEFADAMADAAPWALPLLAALLEEREARERFNDHEEASFIPLLEAQGRTEAALAQAEAAMGVGRCI